MEWFYIIFDKKYTMRLLFVIAMMGLGLSWNACNTANSTPVHEENAVEKTTVKADTSIKTSKRNKDQTPGLGYDFENNGKDDNLPLLSSVFNKSELSGISVTYSDRLNKALAGSERYLQRKNRTHSLQSGLTMTDAQIKSTIANLKKWQNEGGALEDYVDFYQLQGEDSKGNVHYTGYYIPVLKVKNQPDEEFKYPLYRKPTNWNGRLPNREKIDTDKVLANKGLEIAWSNDLLENYIMQVQGSGVVEYPDGTRQLLSYGGKNGYGYRSLGKYLVAQGHVPAEKISLTAIRNWMAANPDSLEPVLNLNPSYVFFKPNNAEPSGAAGVPLVGTHSIAVDKKMIPLGSILLGEVPVLDKDGTLIRHEYRILAAHDVGGAIKKGHVDFYSGTGKEGEDIANALHHYGKLWLLMPK